MKVKMMKKLRNKKENKEVRELWYLRFWIKDKLSVYCSRTEKYNVRLYCYKLGFWTEGNKKYLLGLIRMEGFKKNKDDFIKDLKKDPRLKYLLRYGDIFIALTFSQIKEAEKLSQDEYFNNSLIYISPVIVDKDSKEYWEVASFYKDATLKLKKINEELFKKYEGKILEFGKKKINNKWIFQILSSCRNFEKIKNSFFAEKNGKA